MPGTSQGIAAEAARASLRGPCAVPPSRIRQRLIDRDPRPRADFATNPLPIRARLPRASPGLHARITKASPEANPWTPSTPCAARNPAMTSPAFVANVAEHTASTPAPTPFRLDFADLVAKISRLPSTHNKLTGGVPLLPPIRYILPIQHDGRPTYGTGTMSSVLATITSPARPQIPDPPTRLCLTHGILPAST